MKLKTVLLFILFGLVMGIGGYKYYQYMESSNYKIEGTTIDIKSGGTSLKLEKIIINNCIYLVLTSKSNNAIIPTVDQPDICFQTMGAVPHDVK